MDTVWHPRQTGTNISQGIQYGSWWLMSHFGFRGGKAASPPFKCMENGRVEDCAGQPDTAGSTAQCPGGCSQELFLIPNLIQLILGQFCRSVPPGRCQMPPSIPDARDFPDAGDSLLTTVSRDGGSLLFHLAVNQSTATSGSCPTATSLPAQGEHRCSRAGDLAHLSLQSPKHPGRCWTDCFGVPHVGQCCRTSSFHGLGAKKTQGCADTSKARQGHPHIYRTPALMFIIKVKSY